VVVIEHTESAWSAAKMMREHHVGDVIIVRSENGRRIPVGIVTDRDLALEVVAQDVDPHEVLANDLFTAGRLITASVDDDLEETLETMRANGIRRIPVLGRDGTLAGILTVDDMLDLLSEQLTGIVHLVGLQRTREEHRR
jgi:CBS domain-containing protein